ncbi:MAG: AhpC/TSA family protein [Thalassobius sp.]|nr:AhpC/TSA family protein [Thalassovita sp.]
MKKRILVVLILITTSSSIAFLFWNQELQYKQPTPVPNGYTQVPVSSIINLDENLGGTLDNKTGKIAFLHFFNPLCPCSRFNTKHVNYLIDTYQENTEFIVVVPHGTKEEEVEEFFETSISVIYDDKEGSLAKACGVYSTPQAVIIDQDSKLYFRGNYNKSRYCTLPQTNYAEIALNNLIDGKPSSDFGNLASTAYGCQYNGEKLPFSLGSILQFKN